MTTGSNVFDMAMVLIDEQDPRTGATDRSENVEYKVRSPGLLNTLMQELCVLDAEWRAARNAGAVPGLVACLDDSLDLSDRVCRGILPYGLAGLLTLEENPACAQYFLSKYERLKEDLKHGTRAKWEKLNAAQDGVEWGQFGSWG